MPIYFGTLYEDVQTVFYFFVQYLCVFSSECLTKESCLSAGWVSTQPNSR